jgi:transcriptional regulator with XRE-family HTH domain
MNDSRVVADQFGRNLRRLRRRADLSQEEVGFRASLHRTEVSMLERGVRLARTDTVVKLAGALEVDAGDLFAGISWIAGSQILGSFGSSASGPGWRPQEED